MYQLLPPAFGAQYIRRTEDGVQFPLDDGNRDYQAYLAWLAAGNTPEQDLPTLEDLKAAKSAAIAAKVVAMFAAGFPVTHGPMAGETLQIRNSTDRTNWLTSQAAYSAAIAAGQGDAVEAVFRTTANRTFFVSYSDGYALLLEMAAWGQAVYRNAWSLKDQSDAAADAAQVEAVDVEQGWPA